MLFEPDGALLGFPMTVLGHPRQAHRRKWNSDCQSGRRPVRLSSMLRPPRSASTYVFYISPSFVVAAISEAETFQKFETTHHEPPPLPPRTPTTTCKYHHSLDCLLCRGATLLCLQRRSLTAVTTLYGRLFVEFRCESTFSAHAAA